MVQRDRTVRTVVARSATLIAVTLLLIAGGAGAASAQVDSSVVHQALLAEVHGLGGCTAIDRVDSFDTHFFPDVHLVLGTCLGEHGMARHPVAGWDAEGVLYVLDSPSAFALLQTRHRPSDLDSSTAIAYAHLAMILSGESTAESRVLVPPVRLPASVPAAAVSRARPSRVIVLSTHYARIVLTTFDDLRLATGTVFLDLRTGAVYGKLETLWVRQPPVQ